jgi:hypothetical protein
MEEFREEERVNRMLLKLSSYPEWGELDSMLQGKVGFLKSTAVDDCVTSEDISFRRGLITGLQIVLSVREESQEAITDYE